MIQENGKITVKHYLNKRALPLTYEGVDFFPLYIQIIAAGHKAQIKSKLCDYLYPYCGIIQNKFNSDELTRIINEGYLSEKLLSEIYQNKLYPLYYIIEDELNIIYKIISNSRTVKTKSFSLVNFGNRYDIHLQDTAEILDKAVKKMYINELNKIFLQSTKDMSARKLFKVANYFIHFINWENSFTDYYETTYEVLPSEIKFLENHLSEELKKTIKASMAFHSKYNFLKRTLDKIEKGKFPLINYIDWLEEGKDFITREFMKIFGKQKATEYVNAIDQILNKEIRTVSVIRPS